MNFSGGDLSSNCGLMFIGQFMDNTGITSFIKNNFRADGKRRAEHTDVDILMQLIYQNLAGYTTDDAADHLAHEPIMTTLLHKDRLASQPTISRFHSRMDNIASLEHNDILVYMRKRAYEICPPKTVTFDIDTTILPAYGKQIGAEYIHHYRAVGYHPLLCYDGETGDLLKAELREGSMYCGNGAADFIKPLLKEYKQNYPKTKVLVRGDSGFAMPDLYECVEGFAGARYVIRLKDNAVLESKVQQKTKEFMDKAAVQGNIPKPIYGEFMYAAAKWKKERRVVYKIELRTSEGATELFPSCTFIVTNRDDSPEDIIKIYCQRGNMENFIKESKNEFNFTGMSSHEQIVNENRLLVACLAYNIFNLFRRLCMPEKWKKFRANEIRMRILHIAGRCVRHAKEKFFRLCSTYVYKEQFAFIHSKLNSLEAFASS
jgi:hypothetical protein